MRVFLTVVGLKEIYSITRSVDTPGVDTPSFNLQIIIETGCLVHKKLPLITLETNVVAYLISLWLLRQVTKGQGL